MLLEHCHNLSFTDGLCLLFWHGWVLAQKQYGLQSLKYLLSASLQKVSQPLFQTKREIVRFPAFTRYYLILLNTYCVKSTFCAWLHWVLTRTSQQLSHKSNEVTQIMGVGVGGVVCWPWESTSQLTFPAMQESSSGSYHYPFEWLLHMIKNDLKYDLNHLNIIFKVVTSFHVYLYSYGKNQWK